MCAPDLGVVTPTSSHLSSQMVGQHRSVQTTPERSGLPGWEAAPRGGYPSGGSAPALTPVLSWAFSTLTPWIGVLSPDVKCR